MIYRQLFLAFIASKNLKFVLNSYLPTVLNFYDKNLIFFLNSYLLKMLRTVGDKSQNNFATESTSNFSGLYKRVWPAKLTNHSVRTY